MSTPTLIKSRRAALAVAGWVIVKYAAPATDNSVSPAAAATDVLAGVADKQGADAGGLLDVHLSGLSEVRLGATMASGDKFTSDANGAAVKAVGASGATHNVVGVILAPGVAGDVVACHISPSLIKLP